MFGHRAAGSGGGAGRGVARLDLDRDLERERERERERARDSRLRGGVRPRGCAAGERCRFRAEYRLPACRGDGGGRRPGVVRGSLYSSSVDVESLALPDDSDGLSSGAKKGGFYHNTGEGGVSPYHLKGGADLVWQLGTAKFGCRNVDGSFYSYYRVVLDEIAAARDVGKPTAQV